MLEKKLQDKELDKLKKQKEKEDAKAEKKLKHDKEKEAALKRKAEEKEAGTQIPTTTAKKRKRFTSHVLNDITTDDFAILQAVTRTDWPSSITKCDSFNELVDAICDSCGTRAILARLRKGAAKKVLDAQKQVSCLHHTDMSAWVCVGGDDGSSSLAPRSNFHVANFDVLKGLWI